MTPSLCVPPRYIEFLETELNLPLSRPTILDLDAMAQEVAALSNRFVHRDRLTERYLDSPDLERAYFLYFGTTHLPRMFFPLSELAGTGFFARPEIRLADLGSGTGAALFGTCFWLEGRYASDVKAVAVDHSSSALQKLSERFAKLFPKVTLQTVRGDLAKPLELDGAFDLITAAHVLNEIPEDEFFPSRLRQWLKPDGVVILMEPALPETSRRLLRLRDRMIAEGWHVLSPCFRGAPCPALDADWCHQDLPWERPAFIRWIDERIGLIKKSLKFSCIVLSPQGEPYPKLWRVVSERFDEKGRTRIYLCGGAGRHVFVQNKRDRTEGNRAFAKLKRYDVVECEDIAVRAHDRSVGKESKVRLVSRGGAIDQTIDGADKFVDTE